MYRHRDTEVCKLPDVFLPVETIMKCDDFKSNFARRFSNRYKSKSNNVSNRNTPSRRSHPVAAEYDNATIPEKPDTVISSEGAKLKDEDSLPRESQQEALPPKRCSITSSVIRHSHMEVETLRWQLAQTEAHRQMHISLLKQIVNLLTRVKEHIEQTNDGSRRKPSLPRSRSVAHVNKNIEYSLTPKKMCTKKISKSISNVNGCQDMWNQTNMTMETTERVGAHKISEEISRLIILATTVLATEIPDLSCSCNNIAKDNEPGTEVLSSNTPFNCPVVKVTGTENDTNNTDPTDNHHELSNSIGKHTNDDSIKELEEANANINNNAESCVSIVHAEETDATTASIEDHKSADSSTPVEVKVDDASNSVTNKPNNFVAANLIEDESGFSSMSSFQEIGIPIISIVPPSPLHKANGFPNDISDIFANKDKWESAADIGKQPLKVFWV